MPNFWKIVNSVIEKADVVLEVVDARFIEISRNSELEKKVIAKNKKLLLVMNKADLANRCLLEVHKKKILAEFSERKGLFDLVYVSATKRLGTSMLKRKVVKLANKPSVVAAVVGYPNTGKSSIINSLAGRSKAKSSSEPGFTKGMQLIRASRRLMLIDTPGVIPFKEEDSFKHSVIAAIDPSRLKDPVSVALQLIECYKPAIIRYYGLELNDNSKCSDTNDTAECNNKAVEDNKSAGLDNSIDSNNSIDNNKAKKNSNSNKTEESNSLFEEHNNSLFCANREKSRKRGENEQSPEAVLELAAKKKGLFLKGSAPNTELMARKLIKDVQKGKIRL